MTSEHSDLINRRRWNAWTDLPAPYNLDSR